MQRILLIGHDPRDCHQISGTLCGLGFGVDVAYDIRTGLFLANRRAYSHVLVDHDVDDRNGIRLYARLQTIQQGMQGILLTAAANLNTVVGAVNVGMRRVLAKPIDYSQLIPLLNPSARMPVRRTAKVRSESEIARLSQHEIRESLETEELIAIIRSVEYPFAGKDRLEHFDRDTLERVVHLICRWCRQQTASTRPDGASAAGDTRANVASAN